MSSQTPPAAETVPEIVSAPVTTPDPAVTLDGLAAQTSMDDGSDVLVDAAPEVAYPDRPWGLIGGVIGVLALGGLVFGTLISRQQSNKADTMVATRSSANATGLGAPIPPAPDLFAQAPVDPFMMAQAGTPPVDPVQTPATTPSTAEMGSPNWQVASPPPPPPPPPAIIYSPPPPPRSDPFPPSPNPPMPAPPAVKPAADLGQRMRSPALIIDLSTPSAPTAADGTPAPAPSIAGSDNDAFTARVAGTETPAARAGSLRNPKLTVPQGAMISAVLETAINSDLPGFVRAIVSRDVTGFDGSRVLIPRGSRLVGQYRSEVALGQSRAFVVWTRLIRPDGVSVQLASPGTDTLGRAGLDGRVNRHYLQRYGPGFLTTAISAALSSTNRSNQLVIGTAQNAAGAATTGEAIKPTVTVAQGTAIQVFVARDLDFSNTTRPSGSSTP